MGLLAVWLLAHSWYPAECCSDRDCHPIPETEVRAMSGGYLYKGRFIPEAKTRIGQDGSYHICYWPKDDVICFFKPYSGV